jgi:hypothetical protein
MLDSSWAKNSFPLCGQSSMAGLNLPFLQAGNWGPRWRRDWSLAVSQWTRLRWSSCLWAQPPLAELLSQAVRGSPDGLQRKGAIPSPSGMG